MPGSGTGVRTHYVRDATGIILAVYESRPAASSTTLPTPSLVEQPLYGNTRISERRPTANVPTGPTYGRTLGLKYYEVSDHLGNVRAVVTDQKTSTLDATTGRPLLSSLQPVLDNYYHYYPFGQLQPGRYGSGNSTASGGYRFGYNGMEKEELDGSVDNIYTSEYRILNSKIGRWLSVDPKPSVFESPYVGFSDSPIAFSDPKGDSTRYVNKRGETLLLSHDNMSNSVTVINWKHIPIFNAAVSEAKRLGIDLNSNDANVKLRKLGVNYLIKDFVRLYEKSMSVLLPNDSRYDANEKITKQHPEVQAFSALDGHNIVYGDIYVSKSPDGYILPNSGPDSHVHPDEGAHYKIKEKGNWVGSLYVPIGPSDDDYRRAEGTPNNRGIFNTVVSKSVIYFYNKETIKRWHDRPARSEKDKDGHFSTPRTFKK